ncbi:MAG: tetratricopeptide repeat protein [candidate division WOR-3 bacterium]|nr:tetratricopeptide repeat protein [candidate division WOR-3 bacterium]MCX7836485.1 tetratricopeptide repeat protein [candidate division WOR-3 bacterium]MDW8114536.1 tetratricopeptide repeat protein [candidate division WOR-3 bacterium]
MTILIIFIIFVLFVAFYSIIINLIKKPKFFPLLFTESLISYITGKKEEAIKKMEELVKSNSEFIDGYLYLVNWYQERGEKEKAKRITELLSLRRNLPKDKELIIFKKLSHFLAEDGRYFKAISLLEEIIKSGFKDKESGLFLFTLYLKTENYSQARDFLNKYGKDLFNNEQLATYYAELGNRLLKNDKKEGKEYLEKSLKYNEKSFYSLFYLGKYYEEEKEYEKAISYWLKILNYYPHKLSFLKEKLANALFSLGRYDELVNIYKELGRKTKEKEYYFEIFEFYEKMENLKEAINILEKEKDSIPEIYLLLTKGYLKLNEWEKAYRSLDNYIEALKETKKLNCPYCQKELGEISAVCFECWQWNV